MGDAKISSSLIADGCRIGDNVTIENSVIGLRTVIGDNVTIKDSVVMGADYIETADLTTRSRSYWHRKRDNDSWDDPR